MGRRRPRVSKFSYEQHHQRGNTTVLVQLKDIVESLIILTLIIVLIGVSIPMSILHATLKMYERGI